jgi:hypothetical protein
LFIPENYSEDQIEKLKEYYLKPVPKKKFLIEENDGNETESKI